MLDFVAMRIDQIRKLPLAREGLQLSGKYASFGPVKVDVYVDRAANVAYQVDERNRRFRACSLAAREYEYGPWQAFEP